MKKIVIIIALLFALSGSSKGMEQENGSRHPSNISTHTNFTGQTEWQNCTTGCTHTEYENSSEEEEEDAFIKQYTQIVGDHSTLPDTGISDKTILLRTLGSKTSEPVQSQPIKKLSILKKLFKKKPANTEEKTIFNPLIKDPEVYRKALHYLNYHEIIQ